MLTAIKFKNYKAFQEGNLEIKPLTILLGANSVGKSSLIQLFLMLQETALAQNYKSALKLHGGFFSLGEPINLFRKKDVNNPLKLVTEFNENGMMDMLQKQFIDRYFEEVISYCVFIISRSSDNEKNIKFIQEKFFKDPSFKQTKNLYALGVIGAPSNIGNISTDDLSQLIKLTQETLGNLKGKGTTGDVARSNIILGTRMVTPNFLENRDELISTFDLLKRIQSIKGIQNVKLEYTFKYTEGVLKIQTFKCSLGSAEIVQVNFERSSEKDFVTSSVVDFSKSSTKQLQEIAKMFRDNRTIFSFINRYEVQERSNSFLAYYFVNFVSTIINKVEESFNSQRINYVSPLRAHPKRYYFLDKAKVNTFLDTLDGEAIAEILKENSSLKNSVNTWFKKFNIQIDVGPIKDIIHQIVVRQNALDLDITDVGFGVSQILPVIIQGFLSKEKSITLIEQPEIHLHPKMQADLADLFIEISTKNHKKGQSATNKYLIIETHSEYLLKRLRRRLSEKKISPEQVGIYYVEPQDASQGAIIRKIDIETKGAFDWPKDFYTGELALDVTEFLKNQI